MNSFPMEVGRVVLSRAGRDQGHLFVIVDVIDENYVAIANGCQRKVDNPKKKKIKHEGFPVVLSGVAWRLGTPTACAPGSPRIGIQWARRRGADHRSGNWDCVEQGTT